MHAEGPLLILAGAGSGKTRVITMRTAYLIYKGVSANSVLAVTFTNKAAKEMRERVKGMVTGRKKTPIISTFHSLCLRILRKEIEQLGYSKNFNIYDVSDQLSLIRNIQSDIKFFDKSFKAEAILERINRKKNAFSSLEVSEADDPIIEASEMIYPRYQDTLKSMNVLDFDDLLILSVQLFNEYPRVLTKYRDQFKYIMVDEYQDTNRVQYELIKLLAGQRGNICVVGDDDQSIYGWRGADLNNIFDFEKDFPGTVTIRLEQNYRSFGHILKAANEVIKNNKRRKDKSLWTKKGDGPKVNIFEADETEDEAEWVVGKIMLIKNEKNISYENIAVIYRANTFSRPFEEVLRRHRIPYSVIGGISYFERKEVKDLTAYLKVMENPSDDLSLLRAVNAPKRGLGPSAIERLLSYARDNSLNLFNAFGKADKCQNLPKKAATSAETFYELISRYRDMFKQSSNMGETLKSLIEEIDYRDYIMSLYKTDDAISRRLENIHAFIDSITHFESVEMKPTLQGFLETMALTERAEERNEKGGRGVTLISFHSSKGLEFPVVFIAGVEEDILPHKKTVFVKDGIEEERRLFYVGITRAMKELFITYTKQRTKYGKKAPSVPSRFLEEMPENVTNIIDRFEEVDPEEEKEYVKKLYTELMSKLDSKGKDT